MKGLFTKEGVSFLLAGVICGVAYYSFYVTPRDEATYAIMECMKDLHSKTEYDRCALKLKGSK